MSTETSKALEAATMALATVQDALRKAESEVGEALAQALNLREKRRTLELTYIDGSSAMDLLKALEKAETDLMSAERVRDAFADLARDLGKNRDRAEREHTAQVARDALPAAYAAHAADLEGLDAWCTGHVAAMAARRTAGLDCVGTGYTNAFADVLAKHGLTVHLGSKR